LGIVQANFLINATSEFLTNAPTTQYANLEDYGTISMAHQLQVYIAKIHLRIL
jgi:hypothetical protein